MQTFFKRQQVWVGPSHSGKIAVNIFSVSGTDKNNQIILKFYTDAVISKANPIITTFTLKLFEVSDIGGGFGQFNIFDGLFYMIQEIRVIFSSS